MKAKIKNLISTNKYQRANGKLKISFMNSNDETSIHDLHQSGALKVLIPKSKLKYAEAVLINTGGGIVGGDNLSIEVEAAKKTNTWITTQASEKVYKSSSEQGILNTKVTLEDNSTLFWCPKETILFHNSKLIRNLDLILKALVNFLLLKILFLGV